MKLFLTYIHLFAADVIKSFDTFDRAILDRVLSSSGLPAWFRHADFECFSHVRLLFKLAAGLGKSWTRDVALYLPRCRYLAAQEVVEPQL